MIGTTHFAERMAQRYPEVKDPASFRDAVSAAIAAERWDIIDHVFDMPSGAAIYRAKDQSGALVYVIAKGTAVVTAILPGHVKRYRKIRARKQMRGDGRRVARLDE